MRRVALVGCGKAKQDRPTYARDLYTSTYFAAKRAYAETYCDRWYVLSAEYELLAPDAWVAPYDTTITDVDAERWALAVWEQLCRYGETRRVQLVVLAGADYADPLGEILERHAALKPGLLVEYPLAGKPLPEQQAWLTEQVIQQEGSA